MTQMVLHGTSTQEHDGPSLRVVLKENSAEDTSEPGLGAALY